MFEIAVEGAACFHEPHPIMLSDYPRGEGVNREEHFRRLFLTLKRIYIQRAAAGHRYYVETNHQFIKNFAAPAIEYFGAKIRIIHLKRDPVSVASSFWAIDSVPGRMSRGHYFMLDPDDSSNLIRIPEVSKGTGEFAHDFYKCLWYCYETEARVRAIRERYPSVVWADIWTEELEDTTKLEAMFDRLGVEVVRDRLKGAASIHANLRIEEKREVMDRARCEEMNLKLRAEIERTCGKEVLEGLMPAGA
jgi:hypothetical protein